MKPENYDFSCYVIKYGGVSSNGRIYQKDCLMNNDNQTVPLALGDTYLDPTDVIGSALLENRNDGVYAYGRMCNTHMADKVKELLKDRGTVSLSPYINRVKMDDEFIKSGKIRYVSLVPARIDPDEIYYPVLKEEEK